MQQTFGTWECTGPPRLGSYGCTTLSGIDKPSSPAVNNFVSPKRGGPTVLPPANSILMTLCSTLVVLPPANSILMALRSTVVVPPPANRILIAKCCSWVVLPPANSILMALCSRIRSTGTNTVLRPGESREGDGRKKKNRHCVPRWWSSRPLIVF